MAVGWPNEVLDESEKKDRRQSVEVAPRGGESARAVVAHCVEHVVVYGHGSGGYDLCGMAGDR